MRRFFQVQDEVTFTASTVDLPIPFSPYMESLDVSLRATEATAAVLTNTLLQVLQPLEVKLNNTAVISIRGNDLVALQNEFLGETPTIGETTAVGSTGKVQGIAAPVWGQPKHGSWSARGNFVAQTNVTTPTLTLEAELADKVLHEGYLSYLTSFFTPPSTGAFNVAYDSPTVGNVLGILFFSTTVPTFAADTISLRELQLFLDGTLQLQAEWKNLNRPGHSGSLKTAPVVGTVFGQGFTNFLQNYAFLDTSDDPIPKGKRLTMRVQSDDTNGIRIIPIQQIV